MSSSPIVAWNEAVISTVQSIAGTDPPLDRSWRSTGPAARLYALLNVAMYEALQGLDGKGLRWIKSPPSSPTAPPPFRVFAAIDAGHHLLNVCFPSRKAQLDQLRDQLRSAQNQNANAAPANQASEYGQKIAQALTDDADRGKDPMTIPDAGPDAPARARKHPNPETIGNLGWDPSGSRYRRLKPFVLDREDRHHAPAPPEMTSAEYARDWHEVYAVGNQQTRKAAPNSLESRMARLWSGGAGTSQETGFWLEIARNVVENRNLSLADQALVMMAVAVANCDAMIASWSSKWSYTYWRPTDAIRRGDQDGNAATFKDENWLPYNGITSQSGNEDTDPSTVQGGSPEHTSGTASFAGACSTVLAHLFGDQVEFEANFQKARSDRNVGPESFKSFGPAADLAANGRIWNVIHFRFAGERGLVAGRRVGRKVIDELGLKPMA
jgi:hypothetical protein